MIPPRFLIQLTVLGLLLGGSSCRLLAQPAPYGPGRIQSHVADARLKEISGAVAGHRNQDILWVHNDSGDKAQIYALAMDGSLRATYGLPGVQARDWEDIAIGPGADPNQICLYIADIGDNQARRSFTTVYRVPEPRVPSKPSDKVQNTSPCQALRLVYPDGPRDAETLLIDPVTGDLFVVSKRDLFARVYRAAAPLDPVKTTTLTLVTLLPWGFATGGDISADGQQIIIRSLSYAMRWSRPANGPLWQDLRRPGQQIQLLPERQGEAICFSPDQRALLTISEGLTPAIHRYPLLISDPNTQD